VSIKKKKGTKEMIELNNDELVFCFPEVHPAACLRVNFQRTLRIPDDDRDYPLPPGLGSFGMEHVDDHAARLPADWERRGGVMLPMYQAEAMWLSFRTDEVDGRASYPFALKVATGKVNAVSGQSWRKGLNLEPQDYVVPPEQPWLDGYCVEKGVIRQFVAMPLGQGYTVEEQVTGEAEFGGMQLLAYPMKRKVFERRFPKRESHEWWGEEEVLACLEEEASFAPAMGLAPGGRMKQEIYDDPYDPEDWDLENASRCFIHLANSEAWRSITGFSPPHKPPTARQYSDAGLPWFNYYSENATAIEGSSVLNGLKSVKGIGKDKGGSPLPENESIEPRRIKNLGRKPRRVREVEV
jgi:hypothetical protein